MSGRKSPEQVAWIGMRQRCYNKNNPSYPRYGGRGIRVCDSWRLSFKAFLRDMGERPTQEHSLDRIDNAGDYEPTNCRWATYQQQNLNQRIRKDNPTGFIGVRLHDCGRFECYITHNKKQIYLGLYKTQREAIVSRDKYIIENGLPHKLSPLFSECITPPEEA